MLPLARDPEKPQHGPLPRSGNAAESNAAFGPFKRRIIAGLFTLITGLYAGCASGPVDKERAAMPSQLAHPSAAPVQPSSWSIEAIQAAILAAGSLQISYLDGDRKVAVMASLAAAQLSEGPGGNEALSGSAPPIIPFATDGSEPGRTGADAEPVTIRSVRDWQQLIHSLEKELVGLVPNQGVVLDVLRQQELILYRNGQGVLQAVPIEDKPAHIEPTQLITLTDLLQGAADRVRQSLQRENKDIRYLLYNTGDLPNTGFPFVFMDLEQRRVFFIQKTAGKDRVIVHGPAGPVNAAYHVLASQVKSLTTRPVSSVARLVSGLGTGAMDTIHITRTRKRPDFPVPPLSNAAGMDHEAWEQQLDSLTGNPGTYGQIHYLVDGAEFFPALIQAINAAQQSIRMRLYIFDNDDYALKIAALLKRRSKDISVQILLDGLGTLSGAIAQPEYTPEHSPRGPVSIARHLRKGSDISLRMLSNPWLQGDHTKVIILDDRQAFLGGMNIGREYRYEWHDLMLQIGGAVVDDLTRDFEQAWAHAGVLGDLQAAIHRAKHPVRPPGEKDYPVRLLYTKPGDSQILRAQIAALRNVRKRAWIHNAYLTSDAILHELIEARRRGVDVRVVLPLRNDSGFIDRSNALAANVMLQHDIRVYIYP